jgi:hypothetical protein
MAAYFGVMKPGEEKTVRLRVKNLSGEPIRLEKVEFPKGMNATADLVEEQNQLYLEIRTRGLPLNDGDTFTYAVATFQKKLAIPHKCRISLIGRVANQNNN